MRVWWVVSFGGSLVSWRTVVQGSVSQSPCEAEYVAGSALGNELVWWRPLCEDMGYPSDWSLPPLYCDNEAAKILQWSSTLGASRR